MIATNELRFVEREIKYNEPAMGGDYVISGVRVIRVLQQWWRGGDYFGSNSITGLNGEWRDVLCVKEEA